MLGAPASAVAALLAEDRCASSQVPQGTHCVGCPPRYKNKLCASTTRYNDQTKAACGCGDSEFVPPDWWTLTRFTAAVNCKNLDPLDPMLSWCPANCGGCYELCTTGSTTNGNKTTPGVCRVFKVTNRCGDGYKQYPMWCSNELSWKECEEDPVRCKEQGSTNWYGYPAHFDLQDFHLQISQGLSWDNVEVTFEPVSCSRWHGPSWNCQCNSTDYTISGETGVSEEDILEHPSLIFASQNSSKQKSAAASSPVTPDQSSDLLSHPLVVTDSGAVVPTTTSMTTTTTTTTTTAATSTKISTPIAAVFPLVDTVRSKDLTQAAYGMVGIIPAQATMIPLGIAPMPSMQQVPAFWCMDAYKQCGGQGMAFQTCCKNGCSCNGRDGDTYRQCVPYNWASDCEGGAAALATAQPTQAAMHVIPAQPGMVPPSHSIGLLSVLQRSSAQVFPEPLPVPSSVALAGHLERKDSSDYSTVQGAGADSTASRNFLNMSLHWLPVLMMAPILAAASLAKVWYRRRYYDIRTRVGDWRILSSYSQLLPRQGSNARFLTMQDEVTSIRDDVITC